MEVIGRHLYGCLKPSNTRPKIKTLHLHVGTAHIHSAIEAKIGTDEPCGLTELWTQHDHAAKITKIIFIAWRMSESPHDLDYVNPTYR